MAAMTAGIVMSSATILQAPVSTLVPWTIMPQAQGSIFLNIVGASIGTPPPTVGQIWPLKS